MASPGWTTLNASASFTEYGMVIAAMKSGISSWLTVICAALFAMTRPREGVASFRGPTRRAHDEHDNKHKARAHVDTHTRHLHHR